MEQLILKKKIHIGTSTTIWKPNQTGILRLWLNETFVSLNKFISIFSDYEPA